MTPNSPSISQGPAPAGPAMPPLAPPSPTDTPPASNELTLDPNLLSKAKGSLNCKPGDVYTVELTVRSNDTGGFDVVDTEPLQPADSATGDDTDSDTLSPDEEEKVLGFKRPAKKTPSYV